MRKAREAFGKIVYRLDYIGRAGAFFIMIVTTLDVILRRVSSFSILGSYELTEFVMVILVFFGIASFQVKNGHIRVEFVVDRFRFKMRRIIEAIALALETIFAIVLTFTSFIATTEVFSRGTSSGILHIPQWPFYLIMSIGITLFMVLLGMDTLIKIWDVVTGGKYIPETEPFIEEKIESEEGD